jgi:hypothetical protein
MLKEKKKFHQIIANNELNFIVKEIIKKLLIHNQFMFYVFYCNLSNNFLITCYFTFTSKKGFNFDIIDNCFQTVLLLFPTA